jgi:oxygen-dependent protoporphyrinogen oxidase
VRRPPRGPGFFVPRDAALPILACSHASHKFPERAPADRIVLRAFVGGALNPEILACEDGAILERVHACLARLLRIEGEPILARLARFPESMPQFPPGYRPRLEGALARAARQRGLFLCGGATGAVGLPDCIASAECAAERAVELGLPAMPRAAAARP